MDNRPPGRPGSDPGQFAPSEAQPVNDLSAGVGRYLHRRGTDVRARPRGRRRSSGRALHPRHRSTRLGGTGYGECRRRSGFLRAEKDLGASGLNTAVAPPTSQPTDVPSLPVELSPSPGPPISRAGTTPAGTTRNGRKTPETASTVQEFERSYGFPFDPFQRKACAALDDGSSVLVAAPTGSGKTVVGEFAAWLAIKGGGKTFYTTPIKALSNQKFGDFGRIHGVANVGLLTGDNSINGDASIVVMTTEVLRNMIYEDSPALHGLRYVVLDEVHYLQDRYRGAVWEEILIHLPVDVQIVSLSATVSNAEEFAEWLQTLRGRTEVIIEEKRPVDLQLWYMASDELLPMFVTAPDGTPIPNPRAAEFDRRRAPTRGPRPGRGGRRSTGKRVRIPWRTDVVDRLYAEGMLPAIYFLFSRKGCAEAVKQCLRENIMLTTPDERREIRQRAEDRVRGSQSDRARDPRLRGLDQRSRARHSGAPRRDDPPVQGGRRGAVRGGLREDRIRHRDARSRDQHAGADGRDREPHEVHGRASTR